MAPEWGSIRAMDDPRPPAYGRCWQGLGGSGSYARGSDETHFDAVVCRSASDRGRCPSRGWTQPESRRTRPHGDRVRECVLPQPAGGRGFPQRSSGSGELRCGGSSFLRGVTPQGRAPLTRASGLLLPRREPAVGWCKPLLSALVESKPRGDQRFALDRPAMRRFDAGGDDRLPREAAWVEAVTSPEVTAPDFCQPWSSAKRVPARRSLP